MSQRKVLEPEVPAKYVPQIQLQMEVAGVDRTDFVRYFPAKGDDDAPVCTCIRVERDPEWLPSALPKLRAFYERVQEYRRAHPDWCERRWPRTRISPQERRAIWGAECPF